MHMVALTNRNGGSISAYYSKCKELDKLVRDVLAETNVQANVEKIEDIAQIVQYGVMLTPGLVINGKVKISGRVPNKADIKKMIEEEK